ncbi:MAG TPA: protein kinase, partial [Myxococcota bacterium]|nr:protein kinase [Myxococcota bacterium]
PARLPPGGTPPGKTFLAFYDRLVPKATFDQVRDDAGGLLWTVSEPLISGSFANLRLGLRPGQSGAEASAIRELFLEGGSQAEEGRTQVRTRARRDAIENELRILDKVGSPLLPFETFVIDGRVFGACKLFAGDVHSLLEVVAEHDLPMSAEELEALVFAVAHTLASALVLHEDKQILHRDLKLENILWDARSIVLGDYGSAYDGAVHVVTEGELMVGTEGYKAPEWFAPAPAPITNAADVYAAGITLCYLLGADVAQLPKQKGNPRAGAELEAWRKTRSVDGTADGPLDWAKVTETEGLDAFARGASEACEGGMKALACYIFDHMLLIDPARRHGGAELLAFVEPFMTPAREAALHALLARVAATDEARPETLARMAAYGARWK